MQIQLEESCELKGEHCLSWAHTVSEHTMHSVHCWHARTGLSMEMQGTPGAYSCDRKLHVPNKILLVTTLAGKLSGLISRDKFKSRRNPGPSSVNL